MFDIDVIAKEEALRRFGLNPCLHIPVAARDLNSITRYIGSIECELSKKGTNNAFLVSTPPVCDIDTRLPVWEMDRSKFFHCTQQVWVHVDYNNYLYAYKKALPSENLSGLVLDHVMNRRIARLKHFKYLRLIPVSKSVNTSSAYSEKIGVEYHKTESMQKLHLNSLKNIQYADFCDIVKILNIKPGGGVMGTVNDLQYLVDIPR